MHLSMVYPTTPTWGKYGDDVGDMQNQARPRGGALSRPQIKCSSISFEANTMGEGQEVS